MKNTDELAKLRQEIDRADEKLLELLSERQKIVIQIGKIKKSQNISILQPNRWQEVLEKNCVIGEKLGLSRQYIIDLWEKIHQEALSVEADQKV